MKPITNIIIVLAIIAYLFLPFYDIAFQGGITGYEFTAGRITKYYTLRSLILALTPIVGGFAAIAFNCMKHRFWPVASIVCLLAIITFFIHTADYHQVALTHAPDVLPSNDLGEGFEITGLGYGFVVSCVLTVLALVSAVVSLLPFKFNQRIERAVDSTWEEGRRHVAQEWNRLEAHTHKHQHSEDKEEPTRFMPKS